MADGAKLTSLLGRPLDAHAEDRQVLEPAPYATGQPQARLRRRLEQQKLGLLPFDPLARADRPMAEPQKQELE